MTVSLIRHGATAGGQAAAIGELRSVDAVDVLAQPRVLIIEDQAEVAQAIRGVVDRAGMLTAWAATGAEAQTLARSFQPHVALVDIELPDISGIVLIRWLLSQVGCGIIAVTGQADAMDRIIGLEVGADDYIVKPPMPRELVARIRAVHRRVVLLRTPTPPVADSKQLKTQMVTIGSMRVDLDRRTATSQSGKSISLTAAENTALGLLINAQGDPVSRERLCEVALRRQLNAEDRAVDQLIFSLRKKLATGEEDKQLFQAVRGLGYSLHILPEQ